jgi:general secretion pathway protein D
MARISKSRFCKWALWVLVFLLLSGCASYQARKAYEEAEDFSAEENYDAAVAKYTEAVRLEPSSKNYKLQLIASRTKAAAGHIKKARNLAASGKYQEALAEYRFAREFDSSVEVVTQEEKGLRNLLEAQLLAEEGADFYARRNLSLARKAIDSALKLDANNARALSIKDLLVREQNTITMDGVELDIASEEPITLSFKDANVKEVFGILSQLSGINFIFDEEIRSQSVSVLLEKATFAQAMQLIMQMNGLSKKVLNSKTIIIYPQSREKEKQYGDQIIQTFYLSHIDAKKAVNLLRTMLQLRKVYVHEERNALVVRDKPEVVRLAEQIIDAADRGDSEVLFDLELVTVSSGEDLTFGPEISPDSVGVAWADRAGTGLIAGGLPTGATGSIAAGGASPDGLIQSLTGLQTFYTIPSAKFDFVKSLEDAETLANPKIRVKNKEKAKVHVGTREPVITATNNNGTTSESIQYVDVGIKLDVEPNIQLDGTVLASIKLEVSDATYLEETNTGTTPIRIRTTNAETKLVLKDGERTIIGGLFEQGKTRNKSTIPILGDLPIIGNLFTHFVNGDDKREILLSITPHIIRKVEVPDVDVATIWSGGEDNLKVGPNFGAFAEPLMSEVEATRPQAAPSIKPLATPAETSVEVPEISEVDEVLPEEVVEEQANQVTPDPIAAQIEENQQQGTPQQEEIELPESTVVPEETIPAEVIPPAEELGPPIVLEVPQQGPAVINFTAPQQVSVGEEFAVSVQVAGVENLYSAPLFVKYDPATVELASINEGSFLKQDGQTTVFSSSPNRTTGQVIVGYKQGTGGKGASGSGTLFNLNLKAIAEGEARLEVNRVNFRNPEGVRLQVVPEAVMIEVQ